jgi:hypothetical protein
LVDWVTTGNVVLLYIDILLEVQKLRILLIPVGSCVNWDTNISQDPFSPFSIPFAAITPMMVANTSAVCLDVKDATHR